MNSKISTLAMILDTFSEYNPNKTIPFRIAEFAKNYNAEHNDKLNEIKQYRFNRDKAYQFIYELIDGYMYKEFTDEQIVYEIKRLFNIKSSIYEFESPTSNETKSEPLFKFKNNDKSDDYFDNVINYVYNDHFFTIEFNTNEVLGLNQ